MRAERRFVRVYYDDLERDYPAIVADDGAYATWVRMLTATDKAWPGMPEVPRSAKAGQVRKLVNCGLVEMVSTHHFRIRGYDAERSKREQSARNAAASRWQSGRNAEVMPTPDQTSTNTKEGSTRPSSSSGARVRGPVYPLEKAG